MAGGFVFSVGAEAAAPAASVGELLGDQQAGPVTSVAFGAARAVEYAAIALGLGVLGVLLLVWRPGCAPRRRRGVGGGGRGVRRPRADAAARGGRGRRARRRRGARPAGRDGRGHVGLGGARRQREVLETRFGVVWGLGALAWALVGAARRRPARWPCRPCGRPRSARGRRAPGRPLTALAVPLLALALLPALGGHAGVQDPVAVLLPANVVHVLAAGAWIGGIAVLVLALPAATRRLEATDRTRLLVGTLGRFSTVALVAVAALLAGGIVQSLLELTAVDDLWDTAFGRAILIKAGLVAVLLGLGALNRRRTVPRLRARRPRGRARPARAGVLLRRTLRAEVPLGVAALAVTGALAGYPPATARLRGAVLGLRRRSARPAPS